MAGSLPGVVAAALSLFGTMAARRTAWAWVAVALLASAELPPAVRRAQLRGSSNASDLRRLSHLTGSQVGRLMATDAAARRGLQNYQGCQSSVDNTNTEVTFGGRQFKVLPAASVSGYSSYNDLNWHDVPEGWSVVTTADAEWSDIRSCVIASYRCSTDILFVWDTSYQRYSGYYGGTYSSYYRGNLYCSSSCWWVYADEHDENGLPRRVRLSSYYGRVLLVKSLPCDYTPVARGAGECPAVCDGSTPNCHDVACGELCEGDGECGTTDAENNCVDSSTGQLTCDAYRKDCTGETPATDFVYVDQSMTWTNARAYCRANYYDLASIHSASDRGPRRRWRRLQFWRCLPLF